MVTGALKVNRRNLNLARLCARFLHKEVFVRAHRGEAWRQREPTPALPSCNLISVASSRGASCGAREASAGASTSVTPPPEVVPSGRRPRSTLCVDFWGMSCPRAAPRVIWRGAAACVLRIPAAAGDWPTRGTRRSGVQWAAEQAGRAQVSFRSACGPPVAAAARVRRIAEQLPQTCALHWLPCGCTPPRLA